MPLPSKLPYKSGELVVQRSLVREVEKRRGFPTYIPNSSRLATRLNISSADIPQPTIPDHDAGLLHSNKITVQISLEITLAISLEITVRSSKDNQVGSNSRKVL